ncbi:MAG TPA: hypothetical protein VEK11_10305 [Thermoanaerobaculia bacterium]|nr:hypothetical protein [Thermoanaerobaculia bacterium]
MTSILLRHLALAATLLLATAANAGDSVKTPFAVAGPYAYFQAFSELWRTDGTARGTIRLAGPSMRITNMAAHGTGMFVIVDRNGRHSELWFSEGTRSTTRMVTSLGEVFATHLTAYGPWVMFSTARRGDGRNVTLWRSDGTTEGTIAVTSLPGTAFEAHAAGKYLFLGIAGDDVGLLWRTDGTKAGTISLDARTTFVFATLGDKLLFDGPAGLWRSDGTPAGTMLIASMFPPRELVSNGRVVYAAASSDGVYRLDLTGAFSRLTTTRRTHLTMVGDAIAFTSGTRVSVYDSPAFPATHYTVAFEPTRLIMAGDHLFALDALENVQRVGDAAPLPVRAARDTAVAFGGKLLFAGSDRRHGYEPWLSGGTPETTHMIANLSPEGSVRGSILDAETGEPVEGALLYLNDGWFAVHAAFTIDGLVGGDYTVEAHAPGYIPQLWRGGECWRECDRSKGEAIRVPGDGLVDDIHFFLRRGGAISGRVTDASGNPLAEVRLVLTSITTGRQVDAITGANGVYATDYVLPPEEWWVVETSTTPRVIYSGVVCASACDAVRDGTRVRPRGGELLTGVDFVIPR